MSLINDMLRDLSQVQKTDGQNITELPSGGARVDEQRELLNQSSVNKPNPNVLWPSLLVFMLVMVVLMVWKKNVGAQVEPTSIVESPPLASTPATISATPSVPSDNGLQTNVAAVTTAQSEISTQSETVAQQNHTATQELNARLAALETAITTLSDRVQESNLTASENSPESDNESPQQLPQLSQQQSPPIADDAMDFVEQKESVPIRDPFAQAFTGSEEYQSDIAAVDDTQVEQFSDYAVTNAAIIDEHETVADAHLSIAPNSAFLDQRQADQARELAAQGQVMDAVITLQTFILKNKSPRESAKALLDIYANEQNIQAMEKFLATANYLLPADHHFYAAKAAIIQQREDHAIELLEAQLGNADNHENYRALLAGLYQRKGKFSEAATLYRRLLGNFGEKPAYWLGYALAQDSLNQPQTAKQAYLRVAQYSDLQPQVRSYIEQRLSVLQ